MLSFPSVYALIIFSYIKYIEGLKRAIVMHSTKHFHGRNFIVIIIAINGYLKQNT
jgi:hypothetical protein